MATLILFNKPYHVLSQFTDGENRTTLAHFIQKKGVYPAGRLDYDSEGLLLLTDDGALQHQISHPGKKLEKSYWVQVEGEPSAEALRRLQEGVELKDGPAKAKHARHIDEPPVWPRDPPIRQRRQQPTSWLEMTITEGRNRQVRRMTSAIGHPTLRLIRWRIGSWQLGDLQPGSSQSTTIHMPKQRGKKPASRR